MQQKLAFGVFLVMGVTNLLAVQAGLIQVLGLPWPLAFLVAIPFFYFRYVGSVAGILGAVVGWHWSLPAAVVLFAWPALLYGVLRGWSEVAALLTPRRAA
ncbi:conserved hypothetical protein [Methylobacterium sp. 4-46]|uniref:hypothetical protein n=1 Tax=unclassified Methylobacterium TaxID=2615210 RepID=UPI000165CAF3|nr:MULTISPECIES: hypothetical protein [Methylobacterium]ACA20197.1 conserved hypothetical protein [Methylobacterium sp. 4-46]WFT79377.1 hypothetical protein QA634_29875 [Methylobacterium nodulans]